MSEVAIPAEIIRATKKLGLYYVQEFSVGIQRVKKGRRFDYLSARKKPVRQPRILQRIATLAIPPAWTNVWICPHDSGHIQATGRDAKQRKQYRYHAQWRLHRESTKFSRMRDFGLALDAIRARTEEDLKCANLGREKVLATVVQLLERTLIRVGNDEYARANQTYGLTTMLDDHVEVNGSRLIFHFRGKSGKVHTIDIRDKRLARIVARCQDLPGRDLFYYFDSEGRKRCISSGDVNSYLREITAEDFTAKEFRTWFATVHAAEALAELGPPPSQNQGKRNLVRIVESVAERLGNTPAICRKSYIHPEVMTAYLDGNLQLREPAAHFSKLKRLGESEKSVLAFLEQRSRAK